MKQIQRLVTSLAIASLTIGGVGACASQGEAPGETELSIRVAGIPGAWNPLSPEGLPGLGHPTQGAVYEALIRWDADNDPVYQPGLASEFELSDDGKTLTLTLRTDVDFTDGVHMDAAGVATFLTAWIATSPDAAVMATAGTEAEATGEYELVITTMTPIGPQWFGHFAGVAVASPEAIKDPDSLAASPVGTGPYVIDEIVPDVSISYVRNPNYWNPEAYDFDRVTMAVFDDDVAALNALKTGQLDAAYLDDTANLVEAKASGLQLFTAPGNAPALFVIDRDGSTVPALGDVRVRRAMNLAFDRAAINDGLNFGLGTVTSQPFNPGALGYVESGDDRYGYDPERARELLAEAGYGEGFDLAIPSGGFTASYEPIVQQSLAEIGIRVTFEQISDADLGTLFMGDWNGYPVASFPMAFFANWTFDWIALYLGGYPDEPTRSLYDDVKFGDREASARAAQELGETILDEAWYVRVSSPPTGLAARDGITAIALSNSGGSATVALWEYRLDRD